MVYFRWRTCRSGTEQYWQGVLEHHGIPGRRYDEVQQVGQELQKTGETILKSQVKPQVAIMQSYDTRFAFQVQPNNPRLSYEGHIQEIYRGFWDANIPVDIVSEKDELAGYKVVVVPALYILPEETATNLEKFAATGGLVVFTPRTGVKDADNKVVNMKLPGLVAKMAGVVIDEYVSMPTDGNNKIQFGLPNLEEEFTSSVWADLLTPTTAQPVARYAEDFYAGQTAATINSIGAGKVIYLGTLGDSKFYADVTKWILELAGIKPLLETPTGIEATERWQGAQRLLFVLNHNETPQRIQLDGEYLDLLTEKKFAGEVNLPPLSVLILTSP